MDLLFICRDGLENSVIGNVVMAMETKKAGGQAAVFFTQEALAGLCGSSFDWSPGLRDRDTRMKVSRTAKKMGIPLASAKDDRWTDVRQLVRAAAEAGVDLYACPLWASLLGLKHVPSGVKEISLPEALKMLQQAKTVIGSF